MKILHITSPKTWRGGEQQLIYLAQELKKLGVEQMIMCPFNSAVHKYCLKHHFSHITYFKGFSANPMVAFRVTHVCRRESIDLIHVHDSHAHNFAVLSSVLTSNDLPVVVSRRVDFAISGTSMSLFKYNHPRVKKIVCVSNAIKTIMEEFIEEKEKLTVVHSGIDLERFEGVASGRSLREEFAVPDDHKLIGNVAALAPHKDYPTFVRTAKALIDRGEKMRFVAIGEGPSRKEVEQAIEEHGMQDFIHLAGFRDNVPALLKEMDLFLMTSETEGLGTSILDAQASEVPVVATKAGGIVELIEDGVNGLLCEVGEDQALADAVQRMLGDPELQEKCIKNASLSVKDFSKERTAEKTLEVYSSVLANAEDMDSTP